MNLRWLWLDQIPPELNLAPAQRREVQKRAMEHRRLEPNYRKHARRTFTTILVLVTPVTMLFILWLLYRPGWQKGPVLSAVNILGSIFVSQALIWVCICYGLRRWSTPYIRKALCDTGFAICIECGYVLQGLGEEASRCPECGSQCDSTPKGPP
jgi:hypothetical protein